MGLGRRIFLRPSFCLISAWTSKCSFLISVKTATRPSFPLIKSMAEAVALSKNEKDNSSIVALHIQRWLAQVHKEAVAEYADKKNPRDRSLQAGSAWRIFKSIFG